ncbi:MAG: MBL fold metallo-hydrolase [Deltaproteobacteria bacterium]|nr:MBL fold metallo-hydrolase [Deltaproteobacteria bacterium]MBW2447023.1 MBL fold metallo-hydrolase [Deltaproteobacteria bacterium]
MLLLRVYALVKSPAPLTEPTPEPEPVDWFDDYFTVEPIDADTIAIGEPRYEQQNYNYLILGSERAILFDSGPGVRDIHPVVEALTPLPITAVPSHFHYDHIGNHARFDRIAVVDLPYLRERAGGGALRPTEAEHLGFAEGIAVPDLAVSEWWAPGREIDLGGRTLTVLHTPGHTPESISLLDRERGMLFTGDYLYPGPLFAFIPGADLNDYLETADHLLEVVPPGTLLLGAHREHPPGAPRLGVEDLQALQEALELLREGQLEGEGFYLKSYPINSKLRLLAEEGWPE